MLAYIYIIYIIILIATIVLTNQRIKNNRTEGLAPYGFMLGLSGSLLAVVIVSAWLLKKISNESHRKKFFNATLIVLVVSIVLWGIINASLRKT